MRILHVFKDYYPPVRGGVEEHIHDVVHGIEGHDFAVLTSSRSRRHVVEDDDGVRVIRTPEYLRPVSTPITPSWRKLLRKSGAHIFHFHAPNPFGELMLLSSRSKTPLVVTYHADIVGRAALLPAFKPFQSRFLEKADRIIVSNPRLRDSSPTLTPHREKCTVVPFGIDLETWARRPAYADEIVEQKEGPLILFVGRLAYYKGVDVAIRAMRTVEATLVIAGDGPLRPQLESLTRDLRLMRKVTFLGSVPDEMRQAYMHAADLFVMPATSRAETFGIAMLQAMACGKPVISTEVGTGTSWVNQSGVTGLVVPPREPETLAGAIKAILGDDDRRAEMGVASLRRVEERFTKEKMLDGISAVYDSIEM